MKERNMTISIVQARNLTVEISNFKSLHCKFLIGKS